MQMTSYPHNWARDKNESANEISWTMSNLITRIGLLTNDVMVGMIQQSTWERWNGVMQCVDYFDRRRKIFMLDQLNTEESLRHRLDQWIICWCV